MLLSELLTRLTCGDLEGEELEQAVTAITNAPSKPREEWVDSDTQAYALEILHQLSGYMASSDEIDALIVYRRDTDDIIQGATLMGVTIGRPLTYFRGVQAQVDAGKRG